MIEPFPSGHCQQQCDWLSHRVNCMKSKASLMQFEPLPFNTNPYGVATNVGSHNYEYRGLLKGNLLIEPQWPFAQQSIADFQSPTPTPNLYSKEQQLLSSTRVDWKQPPLGSNSSQKKKFLIFDRSGDETRVIFSSLGSSSVRNQRDLETDKPILGQKYPTDGRSLQACPECPTLCEESDENYQMVDSEGSDDYHEDTDEINALLYSEDDDTSDSDDNDVDCDGRDEDEVSTGHSPLFMNLDFKDLKRGDDIDDDEVTSLNLSSKRQKLSDSSCGGNWSFINPRWVGIGMPPPTRSHEEETVVDLNTISHGGGDERGQNSFDNMRSRKDKIRETLKVLEMLIPGPASSKDPLVIIDQAIDYLKQLKVKVKCVKSVEDPDRDGSGWYGPLN